MKKMKNRWEIVDEFVSNGIRCFIAKWEYGDRPDNAWADIGEDGFYQYNGYCVIPYEHPDWNVVDESHYEFLKTHLKRPEKIVYYKKGIPNDYCAPGGITYRDWGYGNCKQYSTGKWVIGFDTGHLWDSQCGFGPNSYKKGIMYVKYESKLLAEQIAKNI
jgi:hypothetical protein